MTTTSIGSGRPLFELPNGRFDQVTRAPLVARERILKNLLGQWVSECEPAFAYDRMGNLLGLTLAGMPNGSPCLIVVSVQC